MNAHAPITAHEAVPVSGHTPSLAVDTLRSLPFHRRMQAYEDFDKAVSSWALARFNRRNGIWFWHLDMRAALRAWKHYKRAVRAAQERTV